MISRETLATQVANELRRRILNGELPPGTQLRQDTIAAKFSVSHIPVREAFRQLASEGLVDLASHRGAVVAEISTSDMAEIYEVRSRLETWLLSLAIPNMTATDLAEASALADEFERGAAENMNELNWRFHQRLYAPSNRPATIRILAQIHRTIERYARVLAWLENQAEVFSEHRRLIELCRQKDVFGALNLLDAHIIHSVERLRRDLEQERLEAKRATTASETIAS